MKYYFFVLLMHSLTASFDLEAKLFIFRVNLYSWLTAQSYKQTYFN